MTDTDNPTIDLIIIGNGFDLAHGMKTAYSDYIRAMLIDTLKGVRIPKHKSPFYLGKFDIKERKPISTFSELPNDRLVKVYRETAKKKHYTLSPLASLLIVDFEKKGWADLEQSYFDVLCKSYTDKEAIEQLNEDMELLKRSLHSYLKKIKPTHRSLSINEYIRTLNKDKKQPLKDLRIQKKIEKKALLKSLERFDPLNNPVPSIADITKGLDLLDQELNTINKKLELLTKQKPIILNFNYTDTIALYFEEDEYIHIPIHNTLDDEEIILGYGDETCEMYKTLENANNNELLKYFKSFYYMKTSHYRDLERIISSGKFRIHLMGHSCGLSDRVLLSSLFNHDNLEYIRVYYYEPSEDNNDHFDKCLNISRHFLDKHQMRCKILPLKGPEDTLEYASLTKVERDLLGLTKSVPLIPHSEQNIKNSDRWEALPEDPDE